MNYQTPALRRALAGDYAVGLMPALAQRRFERLLLEDKALRAELAQWQTCLASMTETIPESPVAEHVWQRIRARIEPQPVTEPAKRGLNFNHRNHHRSQAGFHIRCAPAV